MMMGFSYLSKTGRIMRVQDGDIFQGRERRTKRSHPYSYDPFVLWKKPGATEANGSAYTDRMRGWWGLTLQEASKRIFTENNEWGQTLWDLKNDPEGKKTSSLLSEMLEKEVELVRIDEYCNWSNGYPVWNLLWLDKTEKAHRMTPPGEGS